MLCPDCLTGHVRVEKPQGREAKIHGRDTYIAEPPAGVKPKGMIIICPDLFGWEFVNNRLLADQYARSGDYLVYLPDFMSGPAVPPWITDVVPKLGSTATLEDWLWKPWYVCQMAYYMIPWIVTHRFSVSWPIIRAYVEAVRNGEGANMPVGAAGFCWGGKHCLFLAHADSVTADSKPFVDAIFIAHPSVVSYPDDVKKIIKPASLAIGDKDYSVSMSQVAIVQKTWGEMKDLDTEVVVYPGANHGFTTRVDHFNENLLKQCQAAEEQAINWFEKHFQNAVHSS